MVVVRVEYRFLRFILSPITGDQLSVLLLHWDGHLLRVACKRQALACLCSPVRWEVADAYLQMVHSTALERAKDIEWDGEHGTLATLFNAEVWSSFDFEWSPVTEAEVTDSVESAEQLADCMA